jgi:superfamily II DNA or RNA helicase
VTTSRFSELLEQNATDVERVSSQVAGQQLTTAAALRRLLDEQGGAILGDEVGAGKTYVTFALIAEALIRDPAKGAAIFVPKEILQRKWARQLQEYLRVSVRDRSVGAKLARRVLTVDRTLRGDGFVGPHGRRPGPRSIVITRHDVFSFTMAEADRALCLDRWLALRCPARRRPRAWLFERCGLDPSWANEYWAKWAGTDVLRSDVLRPLDEVWERRHERRDVVYDLFRNRVQDVRRRVGRNLLPNAALIVVDEAHNLRSTSSQIYGSLMTVLRGRFDALLFLTATPFQLGSYELGNIVEFFRHGRGAQASDAFDGQVSRMKAAMTAYMDALDAFGSAWSTLEATDSEDATRLALKSKRSDDITTRSGQVAERFRTALDHKLELEHALRPFLIRSIRERHQIEHSGLEEDMLALTATARVPLALVDRMIHELLAARKRTFVSSALTSACSSWEALFGASIASDAHPEAVRTRQLLEQFKAASALGEHPKVRHTVRTCLDGIERGEKTVVFVERVHTGEHLRDLIRAELGEWHSSAARDRLQAPARFGWPSLRENYLHTIYPRVFGKLPPTHSCVALLRQPAARALWRLVDPDGRDRDYRIEKRFLEHVVFRAAAEQGGWKRHAPGILRACVERLIDERYVVNGLDLGSGGGETNGIPTTPQRAKAREPNLRFARAYLRYPSPWAPAAGILQRLAPAARAEIVDAAASAIASSHLQREVAAIEADRDPARHFTQVDALLRSSQWRDRFLALAQFAVDEITVADEEQAARRLRHLTTALRRGERVQFVHGSVGPDTQQNAVDGFNTPLYPEVLIATELLGEGLDLHRFCRRVIHHDLPWNPAKLEQRTGRVDRIGSLSERLRDRADVTGRDDTDIHVWLPYMNGTYDETIFLRVMARRREFRCVLGNLPEWEHEDGGDDVVPIDDVLIEALQVKLGPAG